MSRSVNYPWEVRFLHLQITNTTQGNQAMPTGYTAGVADGTVTEFKEYALICARAFGATIMLRDEPLSSEIPEFEPSDYHTKALERVESELRSLSSMDDQQLRDVHRKETNDRVKHANNAISENIQRRERYEAMLVKAKEYKSPSSDHNAFSKFLVSQLEESVPFDCNNDYWTGELEEVSFDEWKAKKVSNLKRDIGHHKKRHSEEVERTDSRNRWVRQLKESLEDSAIQ